MVRLLWFGCLRFSTGRPKMGAQFVGHVGMLGDELLPIHRLPAAHPFPVLSKNFVQTFLPRDVLLWVFVHCRSAASSEAFIWTAQCGGELSTPTPTVPFSRQLASLGIQAPEPLFDKGTGRVV